MTGPTSLDAARIAADEYRAARRKFYASVIFARANGYSVLDIAAAVHASRQRVYQILEKQEVSNE